MINSKELIKEYGIKANKALGQNFLVDESALAAITELADCGGKKVLEIGPGLGALTNELAQQADKVVCVEVDSLMCSLLEKTLAGHDCVTIINRDFLKVKTDELHSLLGDGFIVAANLPYYITSDSAMKLIDSPLIIKRMVLMMQQEAAHAADGAAAESGLRRRFGRSGRCGRHVAAGRREGQDFRRGQQAYVLRHRVHG